MAQARSWLSHYHIVTRQTRGRQYISLAWQRPSEGTEGLYVKRTLSVPINPIATSWPDDEDAELLADLTALGLPSFETDDAWKDIELDLWVGAQDNSLLVFAAFQYEDTRLTWASYNLGRSWFSVDGAGYGL